MDLQKTATELAIAQMAAECLATLGTENRDALLQESIAKAIGGYSFENAVTEAASQRASEVARELLESDEWTQRIETAIEGGFSDYLISLRAAMQQTLKKTIHGDDGSYPSASSILAKWPATEKSE